MNTWFTDIVKDANERPFSTAELDRVMAYYASFAARLKAAEEVESTEAELLRNLHNELRKKYPGRALYNKKTVGDLIEGLRPLTQAMLLDESRFLRERWLNHLCRVIEESDTEPEEVRDLYAEVAYHLDRKLSPASREFLQPLIDELLEAAAPVSIQ